MSLVSPFIQKQHIPRTNMGTMLLAASKDLTEQQLVGWADTLDWSEPVVSVKRFGERAGGKTGGYEHVDMSSWSLMEIMIMTGSDRLVGILLSKDRLPETFNHTTSIFHKNSYMNLPIEVALINAAIRTGSSRILERVIDFSFDKEPASVNRWFPEGRYSPFICLADQKHLSSAALFSMWEVLEKAAFSSGERMGRGFGKKVVNSFQERSLFEACRLGNGELAEKLSQERNLPIIRPMWKDLLEEGNIAWCANWIKGQKVWPKEKHQGDRSFEDERDFNPSVHLLSKAIEQLKTTKETFKNHGDLAKNTRASVANIEYAIEVLLSCQGSGSLLDANERVWCGDIAPMLIRHDPALAQRALNRAGIPFSLEEGGAFAGLPENSKTMSLLESRLACGVEKNEVVDAETALRELISTSKRDLNPQVLAKMCSVHGVFNIDHWDLPEDFGSVLKANILNANSPLASAPHPVRRM